MNNKYRHIFVFIMLMLTTLLNLQTCSVAEAHWAEQAVKEFVDVGVIPEDYKLERLDEDIKKGEIDKMLKAFYDNEESYYKLEQYDLVITREEACGLFCRVASMDLQESDSSFDDSDLISVWAKPYVATLQKAGVVVGYPDKTFKPQNNLTNAEFITMLSRIQGTGGISDPPPFELIDEQLEDIEVGILMYSSGETKVERVEQKLEMNEGEQLLLSIALPEDASTEFNVVISDETKIGYDKEYSALRALSCGTAEFTLETNDNKYKKSVKIFINQREETK